MLSKFHKNKWSSYQPGRPAPPNPGKDCNKKCAENTMHCLNHQGFQDWIKEKPQFEVQELRTNRQGIVNLGSTCFANALIQTLVNITPLRRCILALEEFTEKDGVPLLPVLKPIFESFYHPIKDIKINSLIDFLHLNPKIQQDAGEFMKVLLQGISTSGKELDSKVDVKNVPIQTDSMYLSSLLPKIMYGQFHYNTTCLQCKNVYPNTPQPFTELMLPMFKSSTPTKVESLIENLLKPDVLDEKSKWKGCTSPGCVETHTSRQFRIDLLPPILWIQLERFGYDLIKGTRTKNNSIVDLPLELSLEDGQGRQDYRCMAIIHHKGSSAHHGHYVTSLYDAITKEWIRIDDTETFVLGKGLEQVEPLKKFVHGRLESRTAYFLVYVKVDSLELFSPPILSREAYPNGIKLPQGPDVDDFWFGKLEHYKRDLDRQLEEMEQANQRIQHRFEWERIQRLQVVKVWQFEAAKELEKRGGVYIDKTWLRSWLQPFMLRKGKEEEVVVGGGEEDLFTAFGKVQPRSPRSEGTRLPSSEGTRPERGESERVEEEGSGNEEKDEEKDTSSHVIIDTSIIPMDQYCCKKNGHYGNGLKPEALKSVKRITWNGWRLLLELRHPPREILMPDEQVNGETRYTSDRVVSRVCTDCEREEEEAREAKGRVIGIVQKFCKSIMNPSVLEDEDDYQEWIKEDRTVWVGKEWLKAARKKVPGIVDGENISSPTSPPHVSDLICQHGEAQINVKLKQGIPYVSVAYLSKFLEEPWKIQFTDEECPICQVETKIEKDDKNHTMEMFRNQQQVLLQLPKGHGNVFSNLVKNWNPDNRSQGYIIPMKFIQDWWKGFKFGIQEDLMKDLQVNWYCRHNGLLIDPVFEEGKWDKKDDFLDPLLISMEEYQVLKSVYPGEWGLGVKVVEDAVFAGDTSTCFECWEGRMVDGWDKVRVKCREFNERQLVEFDERQQGGSSSDEEVVEESSGDEVVIGRKRRKSGGARGRGGKKGKGRVVKTGPMDQFVTKTKRPSRGSRDWNIDVYPLDTLLDLKQELQSRFKIPSIYQKLTLVLPGREEKRVVLEDNQKTLVGLGFRANCVLEVASMIGANGGDGEDEDVARAIEESLMSGDMSEANGTGEAGRKGRDGKAGEEDDDMARAIKESMKDVGASEDDMDEDLRRAIEASLNTMSDVMEK